MSTFEGRKGTGRDKLRRNGSGGLKSRSGENICVGLMEKFGVVEATDWWRGGSLTLRLLDCPDWPMFAAVDSTISFCFSCHISTQYRSPNSYAGLQILGPLGRTRCFYLLVCFLSADTPSRVISSTTKELTGTLQQNKHSDH